MIVNKIFSLSPYIRNVILQRNGLHLILSYLNIYFIRNNFFCDIFEPSIGNLHLKMENWNIFNFFCLHFEELAFRSHSEIKRLFTKTREVEMVDDLEWEIFDVFQCCILINYFEFLRYQSQILTTQRIKQFTNK